MNVSLVKVAAASDEEWDRTWRECDYATYFHSREWSEVWSAYHRAKTRPDPLGVTFSDGTRAILPLSSRKTLTGLAKRFLSSPAGTYGGWISSDELTAAHVRLLVEFLTRQLGPLDWRLNPYDPLLRDITVPGAQDDETHALDLSPGFDRLFRGWTKGHSSAAKKAQREGVSIVEATHDGDWRAYFRVYEDSIRRWAERDGARYRWELFHELSRLPSPGVRLWLARKEGQTIAGALCFYSRIHCAYWHGAVLEECFLLRPVHLLMHDVIRDACQRGLAWFDFNPSGDHEGVKAFKKSFGAQALPSPVVKITPRWRHAVRGVLRGVFKEKG
jgi:CelD/BcsL family acetyltransferase involved in cellulose biosynthesis